jgi:LemA protein
MNAGSVGESMESEKELYSTLKSLFALQESYPDLKASESFHELQKTLYDTEVDIAKSRKYYNAVVKSYNSAISVFPNMLIARLFRFEKKPMFEITEAERENVEVKF